MNVVCVDKWKQGNMCYLNIIDTGRWVIQLKDDMHEYNVIKGYYLESDEIENETMKYFIVMYNRSET